MDKATNHLDDRVSFSGNTMKAPLLQAYIYIYVRHWATENFWESKEIKRSTGKHIRSICARKYLYGHEGEKAFEREEQSQARPTLPLKYESSPMQTRRRVLTYDT
jgi:hypothetical protein